MTTVELSASEIAQRIDEQRARVEQGMPPALDSEGFEPAETPSSSAVLAPVREAMQERYAEQARGNVAAAESRYRFVRPLAGNADEGLIETVQNPEGRFMFGLPEIDSRIRGVGPGELCLIVGFSHSGKTQVFLQSVVHNRGAHVLLFTPDETSEQVLMKLVCMLQGVDAEDLERRIKVGDKAAVDLVRRVARKDLSNLIVIDESLTLSDMSEALKEAEQWWGSPAQAVGVDYLNLLRCDSDNVEGKSEALKAWTKHHKLPVICLHQGGRGSSGAGQPITMTSSKYGGEQEANFILGVRRKIFDESLEPWEREQHGNTITLSVVKSKRVPCKLTPAEGIDHLLDRTSGAIRPIRDEDLMPGRVYRTAQQAVVAQSPGQRSLDDEF